MNNNTLTPETYNIETAYKIVMEDGGKTYLGEYAKAWNKQTGALLMDLVVYAQRKQLPNPASVVMIDKGKTSSRNNNTVRKSPNGSITISQTRLTGTPLENYSEFNISVNGDGHMVISPIVTGAIPAVAAPTVDISIEPSSPLAVATDALLD